MLWQLIHGSANGTTNQLIPSVGSKIVFPDGRDVGISYCRMLLHNTMLHDDSYRTGTTDTPLCSCGKDRETSDHFLQRCCKCNDQRTIMLQSIYNVWSSVKCKGSIKVSESLILWHMWNSQLWKKDNKDIKVALFEYLNSVDCKL